MAKQLALTIAGPIGAHNQYRVVEVRNSLAYAPGMMLDKSEVRTLIGNGNWEIIIIEPPEFR